MPAVRRFHDPAPKHVGETIIYPIPWAKFRGAGVTITGSSSTGENITIDSDSNTTTTTSVQVSGGTDGVDAVVETTVTLSNGEIFVALIFIEVRNR